MIQLTLFVEFILFSANKGHRESITSTKSQMMDVQDLRVDSSVNSPRGVEMGKLL